MIEDASQANEGQVEADATLARAKHDAKTHPSVTKTALE